MATQHLAKFGVGVDKLNQSYCSFQNVDGIGWKSIPLESSH